MAVAVLKSLNILIKRLTWDFLGIMSGSKWNVIEAADVNFCDLQICRVRELCREINFRKCYARLPPVQIIQRLQSRRKCDDNSDGVDEDNDEDDGE